MAKYSGIKLNGIFTRKYGQKPTAGQRRRQHAEMRNKRQRRNAQDDAVSDDGHGC